MSLRPLPDEAVAQIKSSTAVVSLTGVVLELLKNSLDAKASRIDVTVDFSRGGCTVEDDGLGITPAEFAEDGGLGKLYYTSKYRSDEPHLGQYGTFLASLSAMSLLTVTSHHHAYRSHNSITIHHSQAIERQTPTPATNHIHGKHGTRVTVRNLFGNMPVRVKQRSMVINQKTERHRLYESLKKETVGLVLGWQGAVSLKIRDEDSTTVASLNTLKAAASASSHSRSDRRPRSPHLASLLSIMTQAQYISIEDWASWVPASASTAALAVKGAISLDPSPTKHVQFISFGLRSLSGEKGHNELYDQINRLFALSSFGTIEDDADIDEQEKLRRQSDRRFKSDGYTNRQLRGRKGVDRYPMFQLRISLKDDHAADLMGDQFIDDEANLQAMTDILGAMITQWLSIHHFRPSKLHQAPPQSRIVPTTPCDLEKHGRWPHRERESEPSIPTVSSAVTSKSKSAPLRTSSGNLRSQPFAEWSRIKSGKSSFFEINTTMGKTQTNHGYTNVFSFWKANETNRLPNAKTETQNAVFRMPAIRKGTLAPETTVPSQTEVDGASVADHADPSVSWTDPLTNKTYLLNARTGYMMRPRELQPKTNLALSAHTANRACTHKSSQVIYNPATADASKTPWLDEVLQTWNNPVFKPSEEGIPRMTLRDEAEHCRQLQSNSPFDILRTFQDAGSTSARLSKEGLRGAKVISQVDRKFILVQMSGTSASDALSAAEVLVLVDQHAADERIQVEKLLADLCSSVKADEQKDYRSGLGLHSSVNFVILDKPLQFAISSQEHKHFRSYAANFAAWGILYDLEGFAYVTCTGAKDTPRLTVNTLPPSISERCKADAQLLIALLRSALWRYVDSSTAQPAASNEKPTNWVQSIATCPSSLVDMINSRACRSAVMFNDGLSEEECKSLVSNLADCIFPFMCAHGRPSMVPIVDLERLKSTCQDTEYLGSDGAVQEVTFIDAWKRWRK